MILVHQPPAPPVGQQDILQISHRPVLEPVQGVGHAVLDVQEAQLPLEKQLRRLEIEELVDLQDVEDFDSIRLLSGILKDELEQAETAFSMISRARSGESFASPEMMASRSGSSANASGGMNGFLVMLAPM